MVTSQRTEVKLQSNLLELHLGKQNMLMLRLPCYLL